MPKQTDQQRDITCRGLNLQAESLNEEQRTVDAVMATDALAEVYDWQAGRVISERLIIGGQEHGDQVPMLENHSRWSLDDVLGSVRSIRSEDGQLIGTLHFAAGDERAERAWNKVRQGHLTDVSVGYRVLEKIDLAAGQSKVLNGKTYRADGGPLRLTTRWTVKELSLVPIGADANTKVREDGGGAEAQSRGDPDTQNPTRKRGAETENQRGSTSEPLVIKGGIKMPEEVTTETAPAKPEQPEEIKREEVLPAPDTVASSDELRAMETMESERRRQARLRQMAGRDVPAEVLEQAIADGWTPEEASRAFLAGLRGQRKTAVTVERDNRDNLRADLINAVCIDRGPRIDERQMASASRWRDIGLHELARVCMRMERMEAPIDRQKLFERAISTGTFTELLGTAATKILQAGYSEYPSTLMIWAGSREVPDFKAYKDIALGEFASMAEVGDGGDLDDGTISEKHESYQLKTYGRRFTVTRKMWFNDDLGGFLDVPRKLGRVAARNIDDVGYTLLISNSGVGPAMTEDGYYLFSTSHAKANYQTGAGTALGRSSLSAAKALMRKMTGLGGEHLNLTPKFLIVSTDLEDTAKELMSSEQIMVAKAGTTDATTYLPTRNVNQNLARVIVEPRLDAATAGTTAWYLAADPNEAPHLAIIYLRGNRLPFIERKDPEKVLGVGWRVVHDVAVGAVDWRGIVRSAGA